jgi:1-deoxy-D-xylulose-5-phosphate synthase
VAAISGFVGGAGSTLLGGGSFEDALKAGAIGGLTAGAGAGVSVTESLDGLPFGKGEVRLQGQHIAILAFGTLLQAALAVGQELGATVVNMRWVKPLDTELLLQMARSHQALVTLEEGAIMGGAGSAVMEALQAAGLNVPVLQLGLPDVFIDHGDPAKLLAAQGLDAAGISQSITTRFPATV